MPHLFREDLEGIEEVIKKELNPNGYKLDLGSFEYQEIKEIPEDTNSTNEFYIHTSSPYIRIDFNKSSARIYAGDDDIKTVGVIKKLTDIISKRERVFLWYLSNSANFFAPALFFGSILLLASTVHKEVKPSVVWYVVVFTASLLSGLWGVIGFRGILKKFSLIEFFYRKNKPNFFFRNKDQIMVGIIIAVISVLGTIFIQKLFK